MAQNDILFFAGTRNPDVNILPDQFFITIDLNAPYVTSMSVAFFQNNLLIGTDNIFSNQGNGNDNNNNIERVDVLIAGGYTILNAQKHGFPILERGVYGAHDAFKISRCYRQGCLWQSHRLFKCGFCSGLQITSDRQLLPTRWRTALTITFYSKEMDRVMICGSINT